MEVDENIYGVREISDADFDHEGNHDDISLLSSAVFSLPAASSLLKHESANWCSLSQ